MAILIIVAMSATYLGAEELSASEATTSLETLALNPHLPKAGSLSIVPDPSRLLLLIVGVIFVGIAYRRSWIGYRRSEGNTKA